MGRMARTVTCCVVRVTTTGYSCDRLRPSHTIASDKTKMAASSTCIVGRRRCHTTSTATTPTSASFASKVVLLQRLK
jgi:hypothetical protein